MKTDTLDALILTLRKYPRIAGFLIGVTLHPVFSMLLNR